MGGGKTLAAYSMFYLKNAKRALFIVPKGTSVSEDGRKVKFDDVPQWVPMQRRLTHLFGWAKLSMHPWDSMDTRRTKL